MVTEVRCSTAHNNMCTHWQQHTLLIGGVVLCCSVSACVCVWVQLRREQEANSKTSPPAGWGCENLSLTAPALYVDQWADKNARDVGDGAWFPLFQKHNKPWNPRHVTICYFTLAARLEKRQKTRRVAAAKFIIESGSVSTFGGGWLLAGSIFVCGMRRDNRFRWQFCNFAAHSCSIVWDIFSGADWNFNVHTTNNFRKFMPFFYWKYSELQ